MPSVIAALAGTDRPGRMQAYAGAHTPFGTQRLNNNRVDTSTPRGPPAILTEERIANRYGIETGPLE